MEEGKTQGVCAGHSSSISQLFFFLAFSTMCVTSICLTLSAQTIHVCPPATDWADNSAILSKKDSDTHHSFATKGRQTSSWTRRPTAHVIWTYGRGLHDRTDPETTIKSITFILINKSTCMCVCIHVICKCV